MDQRVSPRWPLAIGLVLSLTVAAVLRLLWLPELPLGLHYDEAANGILAAEIASGLSRPVFIGSYTGKEVLFFYWAAAWMRALGVGVLALRVTAAVAGVCTVAAAAWSSYELLSGRRDALWVGAFTAAFLAGSFWHLVLSRYGFRAVTQPLLQALTVAALWRGLRLERRGWLVLAGFLGGATLYTYSAARLFPVPLGIALVVLLAVDRGRRMARLGQVAIFALTAAAAVVPLGLFFAADPAGLTVRVGQVAVRSWTEAWVGLRACLGMFFLRGDPDLRFNLPGRPLFDPVTAVLFLLGLLTLFAGSEARGTGLEASARSSGRRTASVQLASRVFLLASLPVMLLPSALAIRDTIPNNLRVVGLLPFVYVFPAAALANVRLAAVGREHRASSRRLLEVLRLSQIALLLLVLTALTARLYFSDWARSPRLYELADGDLADAALYLNEADLTGVTPYVASIHYRHPTVAFLADAYSSVKWVTGGRTLVFPPAGDGLLILPRSASGARTWVEEQLGPGSFLATPPGPDGQPAFHGYRVLGGTFPTPTHPLTANLGRAVALLGYDVLGTPRSGKTARVVITYRVEARPETGDLLLAARLADPWGATWGKVRPFQYPAGEWDAGEVILDYLSVPVAPGAPPGQYELWLSFYALSTDTSLPVLDSAGAFAGTAVQLPVALERATATPKPMDLPMRQRAGVVTDAGLTLLGFNLATEAARPGEPLDVTLFWRADRQPDPALVRLELGETILYEGAPVHGTYPTDLWTPGEVVADRYGPRLDREAEPGTYPLWLTVVDDKGRMALGPLPLGEVTVEPTERVFEPPAMSHRVGTLVGEQVELLGYDLEPDSPAPGDQMAVTLYWRALREMQTSYTVFVHLLAPDGTMAAQHDGMPVDWAYPTPLWATNEVVPDLHTLELPPDLPAGLYTLQVGMYLAETGARLEVPGSRDDALVLQSLVIGAPSSDSRGPKGRGQPQAWDQRSHTEQIAESGVVSE